MKKILSLLAVVAFFSSCQEDVKFNNPGFQGYKDGGLWQATDVTAHIVSGKLVIDASNSFETVTLNTSSPNKGTYTLGTTTVANAATYVSMANDSKLEYKTASVSGPASNVSLVSGGTGYTSETSVATTGGSGSGLTVNIVASGTVTSIMLSSRGNGYKAGDALTVVGGNSNCTIKIDNVLTSNGEIEITEYDNVNMTVSGKFKFNAAKITDTDTGGPILNFQYGEFYKVPVLP